MSQKNYVHGYSERESLRLADQANTLHELLHHDTLYPAGSKILEAGCGTGAQTRIIAPQNPSSHFTSIDISEESLAKARHVIKEEAITNVTFQQANILDLPFEDNSFDHIIVCFVLEHLPRPEEVLSSLKRVIKKGGSITLIEGDHGSTFFFPQSTYALEAIQAQVTLQAKAGGNALIGRELYPLLVNAGFSDCMVSPRMVYADASKPGLVEGFTLQTFIAMIEGIRENALHHQLLDAKAFDRGISDLKQCAQANGVFCYTFFKGIGHVQ